MSRSRFTLRFLATTCLSSLPICGALAQTDLPTVEEEREETILFEADTVWRENQTSPIIAEGSVQAYFGKRYLRADKLSYDPQTDIVIASGNVSITDETLETAFAGRVQLSGDLRDGVVENFSAMLAENARLAAQSGVREQGARTKLRKAVYTSCSVCKDDGSDKTPTWRVKALRVTRDEEYKMVRFHHAFFEIKGVPILYTPFIQAADPSVERQSGFLTPLIGASSRLGFNLELPYYFAISNHQDATLFPRYTSNDGVLWQGEWRRRGRNSYHVLSGGVIDFDTISQEEFDALSVAEQDDTPPPDTPGVRWNLFGRGHQDLADNFRLGYDVERVSDDAFLRRYLVRRRGDLRREIDTASTNRLRSNVYADWQLGDYKIRADSFVFQDLRTIDLCDLPGDRRLDAVTEIARNSFRALADETPCQTLERNLLATGELAAGQSIIDAPDIDDLTPFVLPQINVSRSFDSVAGGQLDLNSNFAWIHRNQGLDSQRLTASAYWEREHYTRGGHRLKAFAELRGDVYRFDDLDEGTEVLAPMNEESRFEGRFAPSVGAEWSYPLTRRLGASRLFIEPRVQLVASPSERNESNIINDDSQSVEFDYLSLFDYNKSTGYDAFEDGQRLNAGVAATAVLDNGLRLEAEVGQQFRLQTTRAFTPQTPNAPDFPSGLGEQRSDVVGSLNVRYKNVVGMENRFRVDDDDGSIQRVESRAYVNLWRVRGNASYVRLNEENTVADLVRREELNARFNFKLSDHWTTGFAWREDILNNRPISQDFILAYQDECALFEVTYRRDRTRDQGVQADNAFLFRFTLRSLVD
ncbi:MAG: LPS assembly protein LptD [Pseudomonadota bacterium]